VVFAAPVHQRNADVEHPYRQESDFFYLTGFEEPGAVAVFGSKESEFCLFVRPKDPHKEVWEGRRAGKEGALRDYGATRAESIDELGSLLPELLAGHEEVAFFWGREDEWDQTIFKSIQQVKRQKRTQQAPLLLRDASSLIHEMRVHKSPFELEQMTQAAYLSADAHRAAMKKCRPGLTEFHLQIELERVFREGGSRREAYESIVGSGDNATILHYRENSASLKEGDLVLIDAGCELDYYSSDITRTFPVSGRFSPEQKQLYEIVLEAQIAAVDAAVVGATMDQVHRAAVLSMIPALVGRGIIDASLDPDAQEERLKAFFMHKTSHYLGMDVHDVGAYFVDGAPRKLAEGMVITVEPGLYIAHDDMSVAEQYRGIGIRIEDDIAITEEGPMNLSARAPKTVAEIEEACQLKGPSRVAGSI
ncbi:MAG: aminopeptidase P N-terminal domain-containing protein, partial [Polyangiaceae bacterium]|nr:aminopeptidase P N-terminal domain-containing protein [Polyangiaceae bacterium]